MRNFVANTRFFGFMTAVSESKTDHCRALVFIWPRCPWGPIYGSGCLSQTEPRFADLTDVSLAAEDTNPILTDDDNRTFLSNVAMQVMQVT